MFTDCPNCNRQFHIYATQLSAAQGLVRCGYCGRQFNALGRLRDVPLGPNDAPPPDSENEVTEPHSELPPSEEAVEDTINDVEGPRAETQQGHTEVSQETTEQDGEDIDPLPTAEKETTAPQIDQSRNSDMVGDDEPPVSSGSDNEFHEIEVEDEIPEILLEEKKPRAGVLSPLLWLSLILILMLAVAAQLAWFQRDELISRYPELIPWFDKVCHRFDCEVIRFRDVSAIELINRDVRDHPRYENTLLVNATMSNQSHTTQPFPNVQLSLFDTNDNLIAYRIFTPQDYLDESINVLYGMRPNIPVHFVLEVTGTTEGVVGFEFNFL